VTKGERRDGGRVSPHLATGREVFEMKRKQRFSEKMLSFAVLSFVLIMASALLGLSGTQALAADDDSRYTSDFRLEDCTFESVGENAYFVLRPYWDLGLSGQRKNDEGQSEAVLHWISVLDQTQDITLPGIGTIQTRVVEDFESIGDQVWSSRKYFAICKETSDIYYFGKDVDIHDSTGFVISHDGTWRAGENGAMPGIIMPGTFFLGSRYFQEMAPGVAMDRAENVLMGMGGAISAGTFDNCVGVLETSSIETTLSNYKFYCPRIGLVAEGDVDGLVLLFAYGVDAYCVQYGACGWWE
jgi:hypothetical protein